VSGKVVRQKDSVSEAARERERVEQCQYHSGEKEELYMEAPAGRDVPKGTDLNKYLANTKDIGITYGLEDEGAEPNQLYQHQKPNCTLW
jgi:hypothetical protein